MVVRVGVGVLGEGGDFDLGGGWVWGAVVPTLILTETLLPFNDNTK